MVEYGICYIYLIVFALSRLGLETMPGLMRFTTIRRLIDAQIRIQKMVDFKVSIIQLAIHSLLATKAVVQRCSIKKVFLEISQNSRENISARVSFLKSCRPEVFSCEFSENSKNTFFLGTALVAASDSNWEIQESPGKNELGVVTKLLF